MAEIRVEDLHKAFGDFTAVKRSNLTVGNGEFFVMLVQPFSMVLYSYSFVTVLAGTLMFTIVSKFPE